jgi:hypothetical protein
MSKYDLIIDFNTMGSDKDTCAIIDCAVLFFEPERFKTAPYVMKDIVNTKRFKLSVKQQVTDYKWIVDKSTVDFWAGQSENMRSRIAPKPSDISVENFVNVLNEYINTKPNVRCWWTRGCDLDSAILSRVFATVDRGPALKESLGPWKQRDVKTFIDAKLGYSKTHQFVPVSDVNFWEKHYSPSDSTWSVFSDMLRMQAIVRAENDLEMIER